MDKFILDSQFLNYRIIQSLVIYFQKFSGTEPADLKSMLVNEIVITIKPSDASQDVLLVLSIKACFGGNHLVDTVVSLIFRG